MVAGKAKNFNYCWGQKNIFVFCRFLVDNRFLKMREWKEHLYFNLKEFVFADTACSKADIYEALQLRREFLRVAALNDQRKLYK